MRVWAHGDDAPAAGQGRHFDQGVRVAPVPVAGRLAIDAQAGHAAVGKDVHAQMRPDPAVVDLDEVMGIAL